MRKLVLAAGVSCLIGAVGVGGYLYSELSKTQPVTAACKSPQVTGPLLVALAGDSWIAHAKLDDGVRRGLADSGVVANVKSSGIPGARSKLIHSSALSFLSWLNESYPSSRKIIVLDGGINDALAYVGRDFFVHHMRMAVDAGLQCGSKVIVLNIPDIDRDKTPRSWFTKLRWSIYRAMSGDVAGDNEKDYNAALRESLDPLVKSGQVAIFDTMTTLGGGEFNKRSSDGVHLTPREYDELGYAVGRFIASK